MRIENRLNAFLGLEETLRRYQEAGREEILKEQRLLVREEGILNSAVERLQPFRSSFEELKQALPIDQVFLSPRALEGLPGNEILAGAGHVLEKSNMDFEKIGEKVRADWDRADQGFKHVHERFEERRSTVQSMYHKRLRELQKSRIDGADLIRIRREIEKLRPLKEHMSALARTESSLREQRQGLLAEWEDLKAGESRALERAGKRVTRKLAGLV